MSFWTFTINLITSIVPSLSVNRVLRIPRLLEIVSRPLQHLTEITKTIKCTHNYTSVLNCWPGL